MIAKSENHTGMILSIERCSMQAGPGLRTTVFLKGCPFRCSWCQNPESLSQQPDNCLHLEACLNCGSSGTQWSLGSHELNRDTPIYNYSDDLVSGKCIRGCPSNSLRFKGETCTVEEVLEVLEKDRDYFEESEGGLTLSGGEPLTQFSFSLSLLTEAKIRGFHTCLETTGYTRARHIDELLPVTDLFLFEWKITDPVLHHDLIGVEQAPILGNLIRINAAGVPIVLRCPIISGINDDPAHFNRIAELANMLESVQQVDIMPCSSSGQPESIQSGNVSPPGRPLTQPEEAEKWRDDLRKKVTVPVA